MDEKKKDEIIEPEVITEVESIKNNSIATMHNKLVEARYKLTVEEQRIMLALISLIQPEDEDFKDYKIPVSVLQELTGTRRKDIYTAVKEAVEKLLKRTIVIETEKDFEAFNFISYGRYRRGEGYFIVSIDKHLKPYLLKLKEKFTSIPLKFIFPLRSVYAIRLYELLKQYESTGYRIDYLSDLREMLGIEPDEYKRFDNFERKVLKTAIKEINEKTDIEVKYKKKKTGRKITHIEFEIKSKPNISKDDETILEKIKKLSRESTKKPKSIEEFKEKVEKDTQEILEKSNKKEIPIAMQITWENIGQLRQHYQDHIDEIKDFIEQKQIEAERSGKKLKINRLTENEILFLLINADKDFYDDEMIKSIIKKAIVNQKIDNIMGFLINTFGIDMNTAKFKELTLINAKIDEQLFKQKLEEKFVEGKPAIDMMRKYWNERVKGKVDKSQMTLLKEPLRKAVYDDFGNVVYVPVPDDVYKEWFKSNFLDDLKEYLKENFDVEDVFVEVLQEDK